MCSVQPSLHVVFTLCLMSAVICLSCLKWGGGGGGGGIENTGREDGGGLDPSALTDRF